jgi:signal transduction histidine kinase
VAVLRSLLPPQRVAQRLILLLVGYVIIPGVVLTWYGVRAVAQEEGIREAALRQSADDLAAFLGDDLDEHMESLSQRLTAAFAAGAPEWDRDPAVAAGRLLAAEPRVHAVLLLDREGRIQWPPRPPRDEPEALLSGRLVADCSTEESDRAFDAALGTLGDDGAVARSLLQRAACTEALTRWDVALSAWEGAERGAGPGADQRMARARLGQVRVLLALLRVPEAAGRAVRLLDWLVATPWTWGGTVEAGVARELLDLTEDGVLRDQIPPSELAAWERLRMALRQRVERQTDEAALLLQLPAVVVGRPNLGSLRLVAVQAGDRAQLVAIGPLRVGGVDRLGLIHLDDRGLRADLSAKIAAAQRANPNLGVRLASKRDLAVAGAGFRVSRPLEPWLTGEWIVVSRIAEPQAEAAERRSRFLRTSAILGTFVLICVGLLIIARAVGREVEVARLKSDFVSSVSHELRTPLTTIRIMAEMLSLGAVPSGEKQQEYFRNIVSEAERLTRLINNVLDFARIEEGRKKFQLGMGDLADTIFEVQRITGDYVRSEGFTLQTDVAPDLPATAFDRDAIIQALINLMSNAVKYSKDDKRVEMGAQNEGDEIVLWVRDHGPGIDRGDLPHLFEKFWRGGDTLTREVGGTGLGLSIVEHIVQAHGGRVTVDTALGRGSTFRLHLPVRSVPDSRPTERRR